ncbi:MAG: outer membrane beta-barrel protein [Gemmatimonadaceae bacterium]|nr:outer membrane beta-barrel protein [Chitinophagaceae bacterium]
MYNLDDKDLDRLSGEAAEHYEAPGTPAWDDMERTLDKVMPLEKKRKRRGFFFFILSGTMIALVAIGGMYWLVNNDDDAKKPLSSNEVKTPDGGATTGADNRSDAQSPAGTAVSEQANPPGANTENPAISDTGTESTPGEDAGPSPTSQIPGTKSNLETKRTVNSLKKESAPGRNGAAKQKEQVRDDNAIKPDSKNIRRSGSNKTETSAKKNRSAENKKSRKTEVGKIQHYGNSVIPETQNGKVPETNQQQENLSGEKEISKEQTIVQETPTSQTATDSAALNNSMAESKVDSTVHTEVNPADSVTLSTSLKISKPKKKESAVSLAILAGGDYTTVSYSYRDKLGFNIGLLAGYHLNSKWSFHTGLVYTKKNYKLDGDDYHPPAHYWTRYVDLETVAGYCRMWELPLQVRYSFPAKGSTKFFAATGASSYFMKKENYNFNYKSNGIPGMRSYSNDGGSNHYFSILHFSAGVERSFGKRLSWAAEPYTKIPLSGLGFGDIKLSSFGINFSVRMKQPLKR